MSLDLSYNVLVIHFTMHLVLKESVNMLCCIEHEIPYIYLEILCMLQMLLSEVLLLIGCCSVSLLLCETCHSLLVGNT